MANSPILDIPLLSTSQSAKETTINTMVSYLERAMNDVKVIPFAGGNFSLTATDFLRYFIFKSSGAGGSSILTIPANKRIFAVDNTSNGNALTVTRGASSKTVASGGVALFSCDGTSLIYLADSATTGGGGGPGATTFLQLTDTFTSYAGLNKYVLRVKDDLTGLEAVQLGIADMKDVDLAGIDDTYILSWSVALNKFVAVAPPSGTGANLDGFSWKQAVMVATTEEIVIADTILGTVIDGVTLEEGYRILLKDQLDPIENGIYRVPASGPIVRTTDFDSAVEIPVGTSVIVGIGAINGSQMFYVVDEVALVGSSPILFDRLVPKVKLLDLDDVDSTTPPADKQVLTWDFVNDVARFNDLPPQLPETDPTDDGKLVAWSQTSTSFTLVSPTAASYPSMTGKAGYYLSPNDTEDDAIWRKLLDPVAVIGMFADGLYTNNEVLSTFVVTDPFTINAFTGSQAVAAVASTGNVNLTVLKNGSSIGSINFNASVSGVFSGAGASFVAGDLIQIVAPSAADPTLASVSISLRGLRT